MRMNKIIHQRENALIIYQILSTYFSRKCMDNGVQFGEFVCGYLGFKG